MKKGFTLIELLIVIIIIAIMMAITLRFGGDFVQDIQFKKVKDQVMGDYHESLGRNMSSRYIGSQGYDMLNIRIGDRDNTVTYSYETEGEELVQENTRSYKQISITEKMIDGVGVEQIDIQLTPYTVGCQIGSEESETPKRASFQVVSDRSAKKFCFEIDSSSCKMLSYLCLDEDNIRYYGN